jgi:hypothetical protein
MAPNGLAPFADPDFSKALALPLCATLVSVLNS